MLNRTVLMVQIQLFKFLPYLYLDKVRLNKWAEDEVGDEEEDKIGDEEEDGVEEEEVGWNKSEDLSHKYPLRIRSLTIM